MGRPQPDPVPHRAAAPVVPGRAPAKPDIVVFGGALAPTNEPEGSGSGMNEVRFLERMYEAGAAPYFDALAAHTYGFTHAPADPPDAQTINFRRVELLREVMVRHGDGAKPVTITESGWSDDPRWTRAVRPGQRIAYTLEALGMVTAGPGRSPVPVAVPQPSTSTTPRRLTTRWSRRTSSPSQSTRRSGLHAWLGKSLNPHEPLDRRAPSLPPRLSPLDAPAPPSGIGGLLVSPPHSPPAAHPARRAPRPAGRHLAARQIQRDLYVGLDPSYPPFAEWTPEQIAGIEADIAREIGRRLGVEAHILIMGYDSLYDALYTGGVDMLIAGLHPDSTLTHWVYYSQPYYDAGQVLVSPRAAPVSDMRALDGKTVAVEMASSGDTAARRWARRLRALTVERHLLPQDAMRAVERARPPPRWVDTVSARFTCPPIPI